jgi:ketosteroid isomerase-like protein
MTHRNVALVRRLYEARACDDRAAIRQIVAEDVAWHDPYPPPHGGDLCGLVAVFRDVFDRAGELTGGATRLALVDVLANDDRAVAIVDWSAAYRGLSMQGRELAHYEIRDGKIVEAWFYPWDKAAADAFFAPPGE